MNLDDIPPLPAAPKRRRWPVLLLIIGCTSAGFCIAAWSNCPSLREDVTQLLSLPPKEVVVTTSTDTAEVPFDPETATRTERWQHRWKTTRDTTVDWTKRTSKDVSDWTGEKTEEASDWLHENNPFAGDKTVMTLQIEGIQRYCAL